MRILWRIFCKDYVLLFQLIFTSLSRLTEILQNRSSFMFDSKLFYENFCKQFFCFRFDCVFCFCWWTAQSGRMQLTNGIAASWADSHILSIFLLFFFSHRPDHLLIRFAGKLKIRSFNWHLHLADEFQIPTSGNAGRFAKCSLRGSLFGGLSNFQLHNFNHHAFLLAVGFGLDNSFCSFLN